MSSSASSVDATNSVPSTSTAFSTESYFQSQKPPPNLEDKCSRIQAFVDRWFNVSSKRVVLVTVSSPSNDTDRLRHRLPAIVMSWLTGNRVVVRLSHSSRTRESDSRHTTPLKRLPTAASHVESGPLIPSSVRFLDNFSAGECRVMAHPAPGHINIQLRSLQELEGQLRQSTSFHKDTPSSSYTVYTLSAHSADTTHTRSTPSSTSSPSCAHNPFPQTRTGTRLSSRPSMRRDCSLCFGPTTPRKKQGRSCRSTSRRSMTTCGS